MFVWRNTRPSFDPKNGVYGYGEVQGPKPEVTRYFEKNLTDDTVGEPVPKRKQCRKRNVRTLESTVKKRSFRAREKEREKRRCNYTQYLRVLGTRRVGKNLARR